MENKLLLNGAAKIKHMRRECKIYRTAKNQNAKVKT